MNEEKRSREFWFLKKKHVKVEKKGKVVPVLNYLSTSP
jgi:hypothetical protein